MSFFPDALHLASVTPPPKEQVGEHRQQKGLISPPKPACTLTPCKPRKTDFGIQVLWSTPLVSKLALTWIVVVQMLGWVPTFRAANAPAEPSPAPPTPASLAPIRRALREMDRFLDHHPLLEDRLLLDAELAHNAAFLEKNPELQEFLQSNPDAAAGLKIYPRYFLYRALLRQASAPLSYAEISQLKEILLEDPILEKQLRERPEAIRDPAFLKSHPTLLQFLQRHPTLARVFIHKVNTP